jgi:hypothetical protein
MPSVDAFPPPRSIEKYNKACFIVRERPGAGLDEQKRFIRRRRLHFSSGFTLPPGGASGLLTFTQQSTRTGDDPRSPKLRGMQGQ